MGVVMSAFAPNCGRSGATSAMLKADGPLTGSLVPKTRSYGHVAA